jgi:hypothetical protein
LIFNSSFFILAHIHSAEATNYLIDVLQIEMQGNKKKEKCDLLRQIHGENVSFGCLLRVESRVGDGLRVPLEGKGLGFHDTAKLEDVQDSRNEVRIDRTGCYCCGLMDPTVCQLSIDQRK